MPNPFANDPINKDLTPQDKIRFLSQMLRIRRFEETANKFYTAGKMAGFLHLYIGQESVAVGAASLMGDHDHMITAYRDHGHALAVGMSMNECMAELFGKVTGCSKGKGGSMHFFAPDKNYWGGHGIVAGQTPLGAGIAFAMKYKGLKGSCMCFLGDGAVNQGAYHESLNLAELWDLPVIYVIENNGYSMGTSQERSSSSGESLAKRAEGYGMAWETFNGFDLYEIRSGLAKAVERAHNESRPSIVEIATYRYYGHSVADANTKKYRTKDEIEKYKNGHDPISLWRQQLLDEGVIADSDYKQLNEEAKTEAKESADFAQQSEWPPESDITADVYYEVDEQTEAGLTGTHFFNT
ncbi:MAG: pyruvate dehydrogenase E1 component alpha subunit [Verrucomicrobiales bacterium]|jgi:pyruvate dehydrogenase E1 component alpha subunit